MKATKVIISPHMDDAALSMGGTILQDNEKFKIITLFGSNWTLDGINPDSNKVTNIRLSEEQKVIKLFKAEFVFANLPEATMRGYNNWMAKCDLQKEKQLFKKIINIIKENTNVEDELFLPAAIGEHVDHALVFETIKSLNNKKIRLYEDLPYATYGGTKERIEKISNLYKITEVLTNINNTINAKLECLNIYKSQLTPDDIIKVKNYAKNLGKTADFYERIWMISK